MYVESESLIADPYANKMDKKRIEWKERDVFKVHCILFQKGTGKTYVYMIYPEYTQSRIPSPDPNPHPEYPIPNIPAVPISRIPNPGYPVLIPIPIPNTRSRSQIPPRPANLGVHGVVYAFTSQRKLRRLLLALPPVFIYLAAAEIIDVTHSPIFLWQKR